MPDAIQTAVDEVDANDELGIGLGHGVVIFGSFVTAGDARILLKRASQCRAEKYERRSCSRRRYRLSHDDEQD